ncbi:MAG TPA: ABC transporter substrate-binding protein [Bryobacteraceae bacterium]|jgi:NitT/TauT family transport system substrate-binding protein
MILKIVVSRHAAFYSPLISTIAAGFLKDEGLEATYNVLAPGQRSHALIRDGAAHVVQSAVSSNWKPMEKGESPLAAHFAQINRRDGFFLVARAPDAAFEWRNLEGRTVLADHGGQPMAMLRYAAQRQGVDWSRVRVVDAGSPEQIAEAFHAGVGDYIHLQGPAPQQLEQEGKGRVAASVGEAIPPVAFSSLCASRKFISSDACRAFTRAFGRAKRWVREAPAEEVASKQASFFPGIEPGALGAAIRAYQDIGCWEGGVDIPRDLYEQALNVFEATGGIARRYAYDDVCVAPPA